MNLLLIGFLNILARVPTGLMMGFAKCLGLLLRLSNYRRKVIYRNLSLAFPDSTTEERRKITAQFYRILGFRICEGLLVQGISKSEILDRIKIPGIVEVHQWYEKGRDVVIVLGHSGPWEWAGLSTSLQLKHKPYTVVSRLGNRSLDAWLKKGRSRFGMNLVDMNDAAGLFFKSKLEGKPTLCIFVSDQAPSNASRAYKVRFLGRETRFFPGPFLFAVRKSAVLYRVSLLPEGKHHYSVKLHCISEDCSKENPLELCARFAAGLELDIRKSPADWLWSHKRWKHEIQYDE